MKRLAAGIVALLVLLLMAMLILAWESSIAQQAVPAKEAFSQEQIDRGEIIAGLGNCQSCHTVDPERPYAGGRAFPTPFGTLYATNITPHPESGIGRWSEAAFIRAMREGVARDGSHLFPAFPYTHFTRVRDEDLQALYAYTMTREPVDAQAPENDLSFPFNVRLLQAGWKLLFFEPGVWQPDTDKSNAWNRGEYLAEGLAHCSACHTPRNSFGAENQDRDYDGAMVNNWYAPALSAGNPPPVAWTESELYTYLREGASNYHGVALGSMADVVHQGLGIVDDSDIRALATYFSDVTGALPEDQTAAQASRRIADAQRESMAVRSNDTGELNRGEQLFSNGCAACHYNSADDPNILRPELSLNSALNADNPVNLIRATLRGVSNESGIQGVLMPGFAAWSNADLAALFAFLRATHTDRPAWNDLEQRIERTRSDVTTSTESGHAHIL